MICRKVKRFDPLAATGRCASARLLCTSSSKMRARAGCGGELRGAAPNPHAPLTGVGAARRQRGAPPQDRGRRCAARGGRRPRGCRAPRAGALPCSRDALRHSSRPRPALVLSALTSLTGSTDNFWQMRVHSRDGPAPRTRLGGGRGTASALGDNEILGCWHKACSLRRCTRRKAATGVRRTRPPGGRQEAETRARDAAAGLGAAAEQADALRGELGRMRAALAVREAAVLARLQARCPAVGTPGGAGCGHPPLGERKAPLYVRSAACELDSTAALPARPRVRCI